VKYVHCVQAVCAVYAIYCGASIANADNAASAVNAVNASTPRQGAIFEYASMKFATNWFRRDRYQMVTERTTRSSFQHVQESKTGRWVRRECDVRLPEKSNITRTQLDGMRGSRLDGMSVASMGPSGAQRVLHQGWYRWRFDLIPNSAELKGKVAYTVSIPLESAQPSEKLMTVFVPAAFTDADEPELWSAWFGPTRAVTGSMIAFNPHPTEAEASQRLSFEMRCRLRLNDHQPYQSVGIFTEAMLRDALASENE
jgi:hypothetical protein